MQQVNEKDKVEILAELKAITSNIRYKNATTINNNTAKRRLAETAEKQSELIYQLARTTGYPEEDAVLHSQKISSWLKFGKIKGLPVKVKLVQSFNEEFLESWCFYLKGFNDIHGVVITEEIDGETRVIDTQFFIREYESL